MARIIGLDLGSYSVKALVLEAQFRSSVVKRFAEVRLVGDDREAALKAALTKLGADRGLQADQVSVAVPGLSVATQVLTLPFRNERQVEQMLPGEVEDKFLLDLDQIVYDYQALASTGAENKTDLLVGAVKTDELQALLATLKEAGVDPRVVTLPSVVYTPLLATGLGAPDAVHAIVDIGHQRVSVAIGTALGGCELARTFAGGGAELNRALAADFKVSLAEAADWKEKHADLTARQRTGDEEAAYNALLRGLAGLVRELRQTFRSNQARFRHPVARVHLCGGTARLKGLPELLERELGVPVALLHTHADLGGAVAEPEVPVAAQAFALAQRANLGTGGRVARFNLRRGAFAFKGDFEYLKGKLGRLGAFAAVLLLLGGINSYARISMLNQREAAIDDKLCDTTQKVLGKCERDFTRALSMLRGSGTPTAAIPQVSAVEILAEATSRFPPDVKAKITETEITLSRMRLRGTVDSFDAVDKLAAKLKEYRCFSAINRGKVERSKTEADKVTFQLDIEIGCGQPNQG